MKIDCSYDELIDIHKLIPNPKNNNKHSEEQINRLAKIIDYQGMRSPIVVSNRSGFITKGHCRLSALQKLKWDKVPVDFQDYDSEAQEYADLTADNEIARWADLDLSSLHDEIKDFDLDLDLLGIKDLTLPEIEQVEGNTDEDEVPEVAHAITRRGDIWLLGEHRVMCGDSTMIDDVEKLMNGEKADMVFTDPPYGMDLDTDYSKMPSTKKEGNKTYDKIKGDSNDFSDELIQVFLGYFDYCKEVFIFGADYFAELLPNKNNGSWIVWDKRVEEKFDKMFGSSFELCWSKNKHKREIARFNNTLFGGDIEARGKVHPTQKPTKLIEWFFEKWCEGLHLCVDLYLGSGSTLIACEKTNRKCYGMELDEHYCDVIVNRWQNYTGRKATLESSGQTYEELKNERS